jgi:hypothetical protein
MGRFQHGESLAQGSRLKAQGSRLKAQGSRLKAQGVKSYRIVMTTTIAARVVSVHTKTSFFSDYFYGPEQLDEEHCKDIDKGRRENQKNNHEKQGKKQQLPAGPFSAIQQTFPDFLLSYFNLRRRQGKTIPNGRNSLLDQGGLRTVSSRIWGAGLHFGTFPAFRQ